MIIFLKKPFLLFLLLLSYANIWGGGTFTPGAAWNDKNGSPINAHGGCVQYTNGTYFWFGEDRSGSKCNGISCYKSTDLYNWTRVGLALQPSGTATEDGNDISAGRTLERPKVVYNATTKKWVMWIHWENGNDYGQAKVCVAQSDSIYGPYQFVATFRPNNRDSRDQTLFLDDDGKAYHFSSTNMNSNINISLLSKDFLSVSGQENMIFKGFKYEAPAVFKQGELYFGLFSECDGWNPTPGHTGYSQDIMGIWNDGTNFATDANKEQSYQSQSAYVFRVHGYEKAYIYMGDRWNSSNVGGSRYVWLPLSLRSGYPTVVYAETWDLSVFDHMYRYKRALKPENDHVYLLLERTSNRILSRKASFTIENDDDSQNMKLRFIATEHPYIWKIQDQRTSNYLESIYGTLRMNTANEKTSQCWHFERLPNGYYFISNLQDKKCLTLSGSSTIAGSGVYLDDRSSTLCQQFGLYFDAYKQPYEEAPIFTKAYYDSLSVEIERQKAYELAMGNSVIDDTNKRISLFPVVNHGNFTILAPASFNTLIQITHITSGRVAWQGVENNEGAITMTLQGKLPPGVYLVKVQQNKKCLIQKMIIQ